MVKKTVRFGDQAAVPAIGLGTWYMGEHAAQRQQEVAALRAGIDHGLTVIDTAEMYADGGAEEVVGQAIRGLRDRVVLVSKVYPGMPAKRRCTAPVKTACAGCRPTIWTCISCTGAGISRCRRRLRRWRSWWPRARSAAGASLIWTPRICRRCGGRRMASTVQPTRCSTISHRGALNTISCPGASSTVCR